MNHQFSCKTCEHPVEALQGQSAPLKQDEYGVLFVDVILACPHCAEHYHVEVATSALKIASSYQYK
ncbi:hypothetical protein AB6G46_15830 [Providencia hangzhouensis]|uniref:hypothetical protein n=1 Tax=Providencia TaxID=586 RepID=UPI0029091EEF|nr:hypothetical protein [Providencia rettgeri]